VVNFEILTPTPIRIHPGTLIDYKLRIRGFPVKWQTKITCWDPPFRFVDEQIRGPYKVWIHRHTFESLQGGTRMTDFIRYAPPGGWLINWLFVRRDVVSIFNHRQRRLQELLG